MRLHLGLDLRRDLRLASRAALLQFLVFYFLLLPLRRRQTFGALGQGHAAGLGGPGTRGSGGGPPGTRGSGCGPPGGGAGGAHSRVEFTRFAFTGRRHRRLPLARLAGYDGLSRSMFARPSRLSPRGGPGVPRSRLGRRAALPGCWGGSFWICWVILGVRGMMALAGNPVTARPPPSAPRRAGTGEY